jgi:hypothetical protein
VFRFGAKGGFPSRLCLTSKQMNSYGTVLGMYYNLDAVARSSM